MNHHSAPLCPIRFRLLAITSASLWFLGPAFDVAVSAPTLNWSASVDTGSSVSDRTKAVGMTNSGDVIAACQIASGTSAQIRVRRLAGAGGSTTWTRDVGTAGVADDVAAIAVDPVTGNTYVAARAATVSNGLDWLVFKVNGSDGSLGWASSYTFSTTGNDQPRAITFTSDNHIAVAGMETNPANGSSRLRVTKINASTGAQIWNFTSSTDNTDAFAVGADTLGNVIAAGRNGVDAFVVSLGSAGSSNWSQTYNGTGNGFDAWNAITVLSNRDLAVAGYVAGLTGGQNFCAARYASAGGSPAWVREINGTANGDDAAFDIARDATDDLYAVGLLRNSTNGQTGHLAKLAGAGGTVTWSFSKNGGSSVAEATDAFFSVRVLAGGDVLAAGTQADAANKSNILVSRYSSAGVFSEDTVFDGAAHNHDLLLSKNLLATTGASLFVIGGDSENASAFSDGVVRAYSALTPIELWRQTWYGTTSNTGNAADTAVPYGNGIPNLAVFAFFGPSQNPATAKVSLLPKTQLSGGNLTCNFTQPAGVSGITYGAESSATLLPGGWQVVPDTGIPPQHNFSIPVGSATKLFLRLKVSNP
jgi:hypothetical protein